MSSWNGWLLIDKPSGPSSNQVLSRIKRLFKVKYAGFVGTLDPLATGLLPVALNEACKAIPYFPDQEKGYAFTVKWGASTTTEDALGTITAENPHRPSASDIAQALSQFIGEIGQVPPSYSAIHVQGQRAYDLARQGHTFSLPKRQVMIYNLELRDHDNDASTLWVRCSRGTYVRSLARDLAHSLGTLGHVTMLRRTHVGPCLVDNAISLDNLEKFAHNRESQIPLLPIGAVLDDIPAVPVSAHQQRLLRQGQCVPAIGIEALGMVLCVTEDGQPVGFATFADNQLCPKRNFNFDV